MTTKTREEVHETLIANGPELLEKIELSEQVYEYLHSERVLQDVNQRRDLKVST